MTSKKALEILVNNLREVIQSVEEGTQTTNQAFVEVFNVFCEIQTYYEERIVKLNEKITNLKLEKSTILEEINNRIALNLGDNSELSALECLKEWIEIQIREKKWIKTRINCETTIDVYIKNIDQKCEICRNEFKEKCTPRSKRPNHCNDIKQSKYKKMLCLAVKWAKNISYR